MTIFPQLLLLFVGYGGRVLTLELSFSLDCCRLRVAALLRLGSLDTELLLGSAGSEGTSKCSLDFFLGLLGSVPYLSKAFDLTSPGLETALPQDDVIAGDITLEDMFELLLLLLFLDRPESTTLGHLGRGPWLF